jgi:predicted glycoside hydrolase/deacetylase ChbG (UPF0249 family)
MITVTADDLGFSESRNRAIYEAAAFGTVSAASLMVNMPAAEDACSRLAAVPGTALLRNLRIGLHFTLTSGRSVAEASQVPLLVDANGMFCNGFLKLWQNAHRHQWQEQIAIEYAAQLRRFDDWTKQHSLNVGHLDSHQHVHVVQGIWHLLEKTALQRNWRLRYPHEPYFVRNLPLLRTLSPVGDVKKIILDMCLRNTVTVFNTKSFYFGVLDSGKMNDRVWNRIFSIAEKFPDYCCEVNVHPGCLSGEEALAEPLCCSANDKKFHASPWRRRELDVLLAPEFRLKLY